MKKYLLLSSLMIMFLFLITSCVTSHFGLIWFDKILQRYSGDINLLGSFQVIPFNRLHRISGFFGPINAGGCTACQAGGCAEDYCGKKYASWYS